MRTLLLDRGRSYTSFSDALKYYDTHGDEYEIDSVRYVADQLVPDEDLRLLLNQNLSIQIADFIYKVTRYGTFKVPVEKADQLKNIEKDFNIQKINAYNTDSYYEIGEGIGIYDTFGFIASQLGHVEEPETETRSYYYSNADSEMNGLMQRYGVDATFEAKNHTIMGKFAQSIFGTSTHKVNNFNKDFRIRVDYSNLNYVFYKTASLGCSMQQKRGGFLRFMNGWRNIAADEMVVFVKHLDSYITVSSIPPIFTPPASPDAIRPGFQGSFLCYDEQIACTPSSKRIYKR